MELCAETLLKEADDLAQEAEKKSEMGPGDKIQCI